MSPFLFSLVIDGNSAILLKVEEASLIGGYKVGDRSRSISNMQFANNTIYFLDDIGICLRIFELISGLKVNLSKSCISGIHVDDHRLLELGNVIGCKVGVWPLKYLGLPLGGQP